MLLPSAGSGSSSSATTSPDARWPGRPSSMAASQVRAALATDQAAGRPGRADDRLTECAQQRCAPRGDPRRARPARGPAEAARRAEPVRPLLAMLAEAEAAAGRERAALRDSSASSRPRARQPRACQLARSSRADGDAGPADRRGGGRPGRGGPACGERAGSSRGGRVDSARSRGCAPWPRGRRGQGRRVGSRRSPLPCATSCPAGSPRPRHELAAARDAASGLDADRQRQAEAGQAQRGGRAPGRDRASAARGGRAAARGGRRRTSGWSTSTRRAMDARLAGLAAELAAGLADGSACPVCGSAEHPGAGHGDRGRGDRRGGRGRPRPPG